MNLFINLSSKKLKKILHTFLPHIIQEKEYLFVYYFCIHRLHNLYNATNYLK